MSLAARLCAARNRVAVWRRGAPAPNGRILPGTRRPPVQVARHRHCDNAMARGYDRAMLRLLVCVSLVTLLAACGSGGNADPAPGTVTVSGKVTFDRVPAVAGQGLVYAQTVVQPARGVTVELLQAGSVRASTTTDAKGTYSFAGAPQNTDVSIRVRAEMLRIGSPSWNFRVVDNMNGEALYTLAGTVFNTGATDVTRNLHA